MTSPSRKVPGARLGMLTMLHEDGMQKTRWGSHRLYRFRCDCGKKLVRTWGSPGRSCGCQRDAAARINGLISSSLPPGEAAFNSLYSNYREGAVHRGLVFELSKEEFKVLTQQVCYYCGCPPSLYYRRVRKIAPPTSYRYNGVDRLDNSLGYTQGNSVPCCKTCNRAKQQMGEFEFYQWIGRVVQHLQSTGRGQVK